MDFPLHDACMRGDEALARQLILKQGLVSHLDERNHEGATPLFLAAAQGNLHIVAMLVEEYNVDIDAIKIEAEGEETKNAGATPLLIATRNGHLDVVKFLVEHGAEVDHQKKKGASSLFISSQCGHFQIVRYLVEVGGADVDLPTDYGATSLYIAAQNNAYEVVRYLISKGADVNRLRDSRISSLYIASQNNHLNVVRLLVESGANVQTARDGGIFPLYIAAQNSHSPVVKYLLEVWPDGHSVLTDNGVSCLMIASQASALDVVKELHRAGADLFLRSSFPLDALDIAMRCDGMPIVRYILSFCSDPGRRLPRESLGVTARVLTYLSHILHFNQLQVAVEARVPEAIVMCSRELSIDPLRCPPNTPSVLQLATTVTFTDGPAVDASVVKLVRALCSPLSPSNARFFPTHTLTNAFHLLCLASRLEHTQGTAMDGVFVPYEIWMVIMSFFRHGDDSLS